MKELIEIGVAVLLLIIVFCSYKAGYYFGKADGIKWTREVYNGKYDEEIMEEINQ